MGSAFTQADAVLYQKDWYTHALYTFGPVATLAAGTTSIFSAESWTPQDSPEWMAELVAIWVTQNAGVQVSWIADNQTYNQGNALGFTDAAPGGVRRLPVYARAVRQLSMTVRAAAPVANFQLNYEIVFRKLTLADQLLYGYAPSDALQGIVNAGNIGGPSAGLAFTLAILDSLSSGNLTGGHRVAATGTISPDGTVGPVGGVREKTVAVQRAGAQIFFVPAAEYGDALSVARPGLQVVPVNSLAQVLSILTHRFGGSPLSPA